MKILLALSLLVAFTTVVQAEQVGDIDGDGQVGLQEAIIALQVIAGQTPPIPPASFPDLTNCNGSWTDTLNNPEYCGDCATTCDDASLCDQGTCIIIGGKRLGSACTTNDDCYYGACLAPEGGTNLTCTIPDDYCLTNDDCSIGVCSAPEEGSYTRCIVGETRYIFLSSKSYNGNLGGIAGANEECNTLASIAQLPGSYHAWISTQSLQAVDHLAHHNGPYVRVDGKIVANNWEHLTSFSQLNVSTYTIANAIIIDESGEEVINDGPTDTMTNAWTATYPDGTLSINYLSRLDTCNEWTSDDPTNTAISGAPDQTNFNWTLQGNDNCNLQLHLYCIEQ